MEKYLDVLQNLIKLESVNGNEKVVAEYIASLFYKYRNVDVELIESYPGRDNILVKVSGSKKGKILAFSGHLDVVAPGDGWDHPPFAGEVVDKKLYGRGACDMKAGVAASIYAILEILENSIDFAGELWFIGTVGEEVGMQGALDLVDGGYLKNVDAIIIPEPTKRDGENQIIFASKGSIMYTVKALGKTAHSSMPELGINAITSIAKFILAVQEEFDKISATEAFKNKYLGSTLNVFSMIEGGLQFNSVPDKASVKGNIRTVPEFASESSIKVLEDAIRKNNADDKNAKLFLELNQVLDPAEAKKDSALIKALTETAKSKNIQVRALVGTCELSRYIHISDDVELLVYGPGLTNKAHTIDEYIELDEYFDTIEIFKNTALKFLNSTL